MANAGAYTVNLWGSNPNLENDDCWTGCDYATREEALAAYADPRATFGGIPGVVLTEGEWVEIDGPDVHEERALKRGEWARSKRAVRLDDAGAASERVWEHRMLHGCADE